MRFGERQICIKDIVAALLKQMEPHYRNNREFDVESERFYFMDGEMNPIIGKVLKYGSISR
jgi:hypothetical protein